MLYWLHTYFDINIFQYITVRAGIGFFIGLVLTLFLMPKFITWAKSRNANQPIYSLAPASHQAKGKTPTMGGVVFIFATLIATFISAKLENAYVIGGILTLVLFAIIGIKDDLSKILDQKNESGLSPRTKLYMQTIAALIVATLVLFLSNIDTQFYVPFYKYPLADLGIFSILFWTLVMVASSNSVNLTDGLDGLATVPTIVGIFTLGVFAYVMGNAVLSQYLLFPKMIGVGEMVIMGASLIGSLIGFLWYNSHPAEIFMGDSGSLSIGAFLGYNAVVTKNEILLLLVGFIFVIETVSVILQVGSFKARKKRIFHMAPIHHHFEIKGWAENKIIVRFWIIALITNLIALVSLKIR